MLTKWFRLNSWIRFAIVSACFVTIGFGLDSWDHAHGRTQSVVPLFISLPVGVAVTLFLSGNRPGTGRNARKPKPEA